MARKGKKLAEGLEWTLSAVRKTTDDNDPLVLLEIDVCFCKLCQDDPVIALGRSDIKTMSKALEKWLKENG